MQATENHHVDWTCLFWGGGGGQDHVGGEIFCRRGSIDEAFHHLTWQNIGPLGTEGTIAEDPFLMMGPRRGGGHCLIVCWRARQCCSALPQETADASESEG